MTVRFHSFDTGMCSLQRSLRCHTHFPDPPHTHTCATPRFAAGGSGEAVTALSNTGRGGGGGGGDRRTTMAAIKDEGLGQGEKPDWIVVGGGRGRCGRGEGHGGWQGQCGGAEDRHSRVLTLPQAMSLLSHPESLPLAAPAPRRSPPQSTMCAARTATCTLRVTGRTTGGPARRSCRRAVAPGGGRGGRGARQGDVGGGGAFPLRAFTAPLPSFASTPLPSAPPSPLYQVL